MKTRFVSIIAFFVVSAILIFGKHQRYSTGNIWQGNKRQMMAALKDLLLENSARSPLGFLLVCWGLLKGDRNFQGPEFVIFFKDKTNLVPEVLSMETDRWDKVPTYSEDPSATLADCNESSSVYFLASIDKTRGDEIRDYRKSLSHHKERHPVYNPPLKHACIPSEDGLCVSLVWKPPNSVVKDRFKLLDVVEESNAKLFEIIQPRDCGNSLPLYLNIHTGAYLCGDNHDSTITEWLKETSIDKLRSQANPASIREWMKDVYRKKGVTSNNFV